MAEHADRQTDEQVEQQTEEQTEQPCLAPQMVGLDLTMVPTSFLHLLTP